MDRADSNVSVKTEPTLPGYSDEEKQRGGALCTVVGKSHIDIQTDPENLRGCSVKAESVPPGADIGSELIFIDVPNIKKESAHGYSSKVKSELRPSDDESDGDEAVDSNECRPVVKSELGLSTERDYSKVGYIEIDIPHTNIKNDLATITGLRNEEDVDVSYPDIKKECLKNCATADILTDDSRIRESVNEASTSSEENKRKSKIECEKCKKIFNISYLKHHMRTHTGEKPYPCSECSYTSNTRKKLIFHMQTHTGIKPFACSVCSYSSTTKGSLKCHMASHTIDKPFSCSLCPFTCKQRADIGRHELTHTGEKPFSCSICTYICNRKGSLRRHMLTHTGEKPFSCSHCPDTFNQKETLRRHIFTHTGEKPLICPHCSYTCITKGNLRSHLLIHTGEKLFSCSHCTYKCNQKVMLKRHMFTHTGKKPIACSLCSYTCVAPSYLKSHMRTHTRTLCKK